MASESVKILIEAEDRASGQVENAVRSIDSSIKGIKEVGSKAKASTEFVAVLANTMGGTEIGGYASQLAGITEKVSQFSEVQKAGGAGAMAFKLGLAGLVGALGYQIGSAIGNAIFQTEKYNEQMREAAKRTEELIAAGQKLADKRFADELKDIELIRDPQAQADEIRNMGEMFEKNLTGAEAKVRASQKRLEKLKAQWNVTGEAKATVKEVEAQLAADREQLKLLQEQQTALNDKYGLAAKEREAKAQANKELDAAEAKEKQIQEAAKQRLADLRNQYDELTLGIEGARAARMREQGLAEDAIAEEQNLQRLVDAEKKKAEAEKQAQSEREAAAKRIADFQKAEITRLEQQRIELTQGKEAAKAFALEQQGLGKAEAARLAAAQVELEQAKESPKVEPAQANTAFQSRLLTRGRNDDPQAKIQENTKVAAESLKTIAQLFQEQQQAAATKPDKDAGILLVEFKR